MALDFLSFGFLVVGASSWITINGLYTELNLMVDHIPEGWAIGSYIAIIIQLANIVPLFYSFIPNHYKTRKFITITTYLILSISFISMIIMSFTWKKTVKIFGIECSIFLLITCFGTSVADCMTSLVFWVFVSWFDTKYISILSAGESSSGIIASILIWIQQLNTKNERYSVEAYLIFLSLILPISGIAFHLLLKYNNQYIQKRNDIVNIKVNQSIDNDNKKPLISEHNHHGKTVKLSRREYYKYLFILCVLSGVQNGMLASIGTYALLPYGNLTYVLSSTISNCTNPVAAIIPYYLPKLFINDLAIYITTFAWFILNLYVLIIALCSPQPWGSSSNSSIFGSVVIIICSVVGSGMICCCKSCLITVIKEKLMNDKSFSNLNKSLNLQQIKQKETDKLMETVGKVVQLGSCIGAVIFFLLVQFAGIFNE